LLGKGKRIQIQVREDALAGAPKRTSPLREKLKGKENGRKKINSLEGKCVSENRRGGFCEKGGKEEHLKGEMP